ncbi:unnamed protein product [Closterium sp. Naga37s-1]|nr:unnamed protein product [Closterium sp. Naga37s-1]
MTPFSHTFAKATFLVVVIAFAVLLSALAPRVSAAGSPANATAPAFAKAAAAGAIGSANAIKPRDASSSPVAATARQSKSSGLGKNSTCAYYGNYSAKPYFGKGLTVKLPAAIFGKRCSACYKVICANDAKRCRSDKATVTVRRHGLDDDGKSDLALPAGEARWVGGSSTGWGKLDGVGEARRGGGSSTGWGKLDGVGDKENLGPVRAEAGGSRSATACLVPVGDRRPTAIYRGVSMSTGRKELTAADFPLEVPPGHAGYKLTFDVKEYDLLRGERAELTERCFDFGLGVLLVVRPGDLLLPDEEEIGTFYRHLAPKTSYKLHEAEAAKVLREEAAGIGLLAVSAFSWSLGHLDDLHRNYDPLSVENQTKVSMKALRQGLVNYLERAALSKRAASSVAWEPASLWYAGEKSGGIRPKTGKKPRASGGSTTTRMASKAALERLKAAKRENKKLREEKLVAEKRLDDQMARTETLFSVVNMAVDKLSSVAERVSTLEMTAGASVTGAVKSVKQVVQNAMDGRDAIIAHMNERWLPTVDALNVAATGLKGRRREDDEMLLRGVADLLGEKLKTVVSAEVKAVMESAAPRIAAAVVRSLQHPPASTSTDGMSAQVVQELRDDVVKAVTPATQQGFGAAGLSHLANALASVMHGGRSTAEERGPPPRHSGKRVADDKTLSDEQAGGGKRIRGPTAKRGVGVETPAAMYVRIPGVDDLLKVGGPEVLPSDAGRQVANVPQGPALVVGKHGGQPVAGQQPQPATNPASAHDARPSGVTEQLADELLGGASVVGKQGGQPVGDQHPQPEASPATAQGARPSGATAQVADELLGGASVVGKQGGQPVGDKHP